MSGFLLASRAAPARVLFRRSKAKAFDSAIAANYSRRRGSRAASPLPVPQVHSSRLPCRHDQLAGIMRRRVTQREAGGACRAPVPGTLVQKRFRPPNDVVVKLHRHVHPALVRLDVIARRARHPGLPPSRHLRGCCPRSRRPGKACATSPTSPGVSVGKAVSLNANSPPRKWFLITRCPEMVSGKNQRRRPPASPNIDAVALIRLRPRNPSKSTQFRSMAGSAASTR